MSRGIEPGERLEHFADLVARIDAFNQRREEVTGATHSDAGPAHFDFDTDPTGMILGVDGVTRGPLVGVSIAETAMQGLAQFDGVAMGAFRRRSPFRDARLEIGGASAAAGSWRVSAMPWFDPVSGQYMGYRGSGRRPRRDEMANVTEATVGDTSPSDSLRQLVHELRTPANAVAGFAELIESELLGPVAPVYRDRASAIRSMAADLLASVEDLDTAARIEGHVLELRPSVVPLAPLIQRVLAELAPLAQLRRAEIRFDPPATPIAALADDRAAERLLTRLFSVLLSNCVVGERLSASLAEDQGMAALRVDRPLALTVETGLAHFWSRSRHALWKKGETSGNMLAVRDIRIDCDQDALWVKAVPAGPTCHTGARSCFFRRVGPDGLSAVD